MACKISLLVASLALLLALTLAAPAEKQLKHEVTQDLAPSEKDDLQPAASHYGGYYGGYGGHYGGYPYWGSTWGYPGYGYYGGLGGYGYGGYGGYGGFGYGHGYGWW